jgi:glyoxylate utilization-related uncharacterized protein
MAIALTTEAALNCPGETGYSVPFATLEITESPDSGSGPVRAQAEVQTIVSVVDGVVYVVAGENEWVLSSGDSANIAAGTPYRRWNAGDDQARWVEVYCAA